MKSPVLFVATCLLASGCASGGAPLDEGTGGAPAGTGGATIGPAGGSFGSGGAQSSGGNSAGGAPHSGGVSSSGGSTTGGTFGGGGVFGGGGSFGTGGAPASGGAGTGGAASMEIDCDAQMPTGGEEHRSKSTQSGSGNTAWSIWTNGGDGFLTTFGETPAFKARWDNSGDYLGRMGFEWGSSGKPYTEYGTIKADYVWNKAPVSGNVEPVAGGYSYLGVYGWSNNPCVEWYIVEDSFHNMPFNTGNQPVGTAEVDGGTYNLVYRTTPGTGGSRCNGVSTWEQFYSIRLEGKRCGTITVSDHFAAWAARGWDMGNLLEVKIVVEAAAGTGYVDFPLARVTTSAGN